MNTNPFFARPPTNYPVYFDRKIEEAYDFYKSREHPDIDENVKTPRLLLDSYCEKFFRTKPEHTLRKKKVRYHYIISDDDKLREGVLYQHEIKLFGFVLASEPTLVEEDAEFFSVSAALKLLCDELCDKLTCFPEHSFSISDVNIVEEVKPEKFDQSRYLKKQATVPVQPLSLVHQKEVPINRVMPIGKEMFVNAYQTLCNSKERDAMLASPVLTFFNKFMTGFVRVPLKFLFYVPKICNDISAVQEDLKNESCILVKPDTEFGSNDKLTYALLAINADISQQTGLNRISQNQIKYISLGCNLSKQKAKINAVLKFFKHINEDLYKRFMAQNLPEKNLEAKVRTLETATTCSNTAGVTSPNGAFDLEEYKKFRIQEPRLVTEKTRCFELNSKHKTPKGLLQEFFAKKFRCKLEDLVKFEITRGISTPHQVVLKYQDTVLSTEANTVKEGQEKVCQDLLVKIYPLYKTYFELLNDITTRKKDQIPLPHMESFKTNMISKVAAGLRKRMVAYKQDIGKRLVDTDADFVVNEEYPDPDFYACGVALDFQ
eukprot:GAHX01001368.1.p1 GENE.GAHX01001368.1~~GAHX01001368.1.p1  ORF type:complete len:546 (-),score=111.57 GAHX01001368.1:1634-3271(-)